MITDEGDYLTIHLQASTSSHMSSVQSFHFQQPLSCTLCSHNLPVITQPAQADSTHAPAFSWSCLIRPLTLCQRKANEGAQSDTACRADSQNTACSASSLSVMKHVSSSSIVVSMMVLTQKEVSHCINSLNLPLEAACSHLSHLSDCMSV